MTELNLKYNELTNEIFRNFIFYIPLSIFDLEELKKISIDWQSLFDKIIYIDDDLNLIFENNLSYTKLLLKSDKFKTNCFNLIEYKETLSESSFNYISEKYLQQLETYCFFSNQLVLQFEKNFPEKDTNTFFLLNYQNINFKSHISEVEKITGLKAQTFNQQNFIQEVKETPVFKKFSFNIPLKEKSFSDFISHEKNKEIEKIILEKFQNEKGKKLRYLIEYLNELGIISLIHGDRTKIYSAMKNSFNWEIGTHQSIFGNWFSKQDIEYTKFKETLNSYFPFLL